jgi:RNA polymerase sigma-54 factor
MSLKLQQKLSFQMIQSLKLLQINTLQLEQLVRNELEETSDDELEAGEDEIDWEEYLEEGFDLGGRMSEEVDPGGQRYVPTAVHQASLEEHLGRQISEFKLPDDLKLLVQFIIGCLGPDGYLRISINDIAEATGASSFRVEEALQIVWRLEPPGIGARDLQECLILQLRAKRLDNSLAMRILVEAWELFERLKIPDTARLLGVSNRDVQEAMAVLRTLSPKPGYLVHPERPSVIVPDLIVEKVNGDFVATLNDRSVPSLHINKAYADIIRRGSKAKKETKDYIREKLNGATWLIRSIEQRQTTMLRVMYAIIERQREFFEKGPPNLSPLKLQDIADMVEISTVSRVTNGKYVQTSHGIFELRYFFTEGISRESAGEEDVSSERIKNRIRELTENENARKPLSDQKIADILSRENFKLARRTVAKYREQLKILPARMRQRYD